MSAFDLIQKDVPFNLTGKSANNNFYINMAWARGSGQGWDLDLSILAVFADGSHELHYYSKSHSRNHVTLPAIELSEDDTGGGEGEDVTIHADKLPSDVVEIIIFVDIHGGGGSQQLQKLKDAYVEVRDGGETGTVIGRHDLSNCSGAAAELCRIACSNGSLSYTRTEINLSGNDAKGVYKANYAGKTIGQKPTATVAPTEEPKKKGFWGRLLG